MQNQRLEGPRHLVELYQLRTFEAVAGAGHLTRAAELLAHAERVLAAVRDGALAALLDVLRETWGLAPPGIEARSPAA